MEIKRIAPDFSVSAQITFHDLEEIARSGFRTIIVNRPDGESSDQPDFEEIKIAAKAAGIEAHYLPIIAGQISDADVTDFKNVMRDTSAPILAFCRTGTRSITLWALSQAGHLSTNAILETAAKAEYDLSSLRSRLDVCANPAESSLVKTYDIVIVGGGAAGIATAASILKRRKGLDIAIVEPSTEHYYQPGWTLVGGGVFKREQTERPMAGLIPKGVHWIHTAGAGFDPDRNEIILENSERVQYRALVVAPGLKLDWAQVEGLAETLGKNGVTSNYRLGMASYTWELVQSLKGGKALFTQPPMPIKCAGAPQKVMYLSCDTWRKSGALKNIDPSFHNAGGGIFGIKDYVPALMKVVERYGIGLHFNENLIAVDGPNKKATFEVTSEKGEKTRVIRNFNMLHICPPQTALDFVANSPIANEAGWVDVDDRTLQHKKYANIFSVGDASSAPNAKTAAAVRKQAPVAAVNLLSILNGERPCAVYNGYGSCPLIVERGRAILAEFGYGGKLDPTFPGWFISATKPSWQAWFAKVALMPFLYFDLMLKGHEWLAKPKIDPELRSINDDDAGPVKAA